VLSAFGSPVVVSCQCGEASEVFFGADNHVSTVSSIASIRPTPRHIRFSPETHAATSTITRLAVDMDSIEKHDAGP
jgi:hypothetical protein